MVSNPSGFESSRYIKCILSIRNLSAAVSHNAHLIVFNHNFYIFRFLVSIMLWLERAVGANADVISLLFVQLRQLHADAIQVQTRHFFVEVLGQDIHVIVVIIAFGPQLDLRQNLVGERS